MVSKDELLSDLRPYIVVSAAAVRAWRERDPSAWAKVTDWLAACHGKAIVEI